MAYIGVSPSNGVRRKHTYTATAAQTSFTGAGAEGITLSYLDSNYVDVYQNGVKLSEADYTSTTGTTVVLATGAFVSDMVEIVVYDVFSVADTVSKSAGGTFDGNITAAGTITVTGNADLNGDLDVDGTSNLDVVDIDGTVNMASTALVTGVLTANGGAVFNEGSADVDFRVESNGNANMLFVDGGNDRVYIGKNATGSTFNAKLQIEDTGAAAGIAIHRANAGTGQGNLNFSKSRAATIGDNTVVQDDDNLGAIVWSGADGTDRATPAAQIHSAVDGTPGSNDMPGRLIFSTTADGAAAVTERMRVTAAGDLLIGKTTTALGTAGHRISSAVGTFVRDGGGALIVHRLSNDGNLLEFYKDSTLVGTIKSNGGVTLDIDGGGDRVGLAFTASAYLPRKNGSLSDNTNDLGDGSRRFDDFFATNNAINTSDRNEKQDIAELSDAETRVAVACKSLLRKFRWKDAVASKGDNARTHFGIIAQDLQDAFAAESLDASDYAMFCSDTWWEKEISVDAVEADEANEIQAKDAYTYTDTKQEATTGYTEKTRLGVRYGELLAFIISAI